ncbi:hypothetical protein NESM_000162800 [Novymonas esmeraldas]|uniref:Uncharacterized protein n=1 Tax=Novymonas esmeraldas TaxID=1808958 RepID=A0AAW0F4A7_9TRYP
MAAAVKKKGGPKERLGAEGAGGAANVQSLFLSAAHNTVWPYEAAAAHHRGGITVFTAAANAIRGRPNGACEREDAWARAESPARALAVARVLPATEEWKAERVLHNRLHSAGGASANDRPSVCSASAVPYDPARGRDVLYEEWLAHVAAHRASPPQYPHHVLHMNASAATGRVLSLPGTATSSISTVKVAAVLHRLLGAYLRRCNEQQGTPEHPVDERVPSRVFASLLGSAVYNINFSGPPLEQKDTTFGWVNPSARGTVDGHDAAPGRTSAAAPRRYDALSLVSCADTTHVNVCVGLHFYKLTVIERRDGRLRSVAAIAADLDTLYEHHLTLERREALPGASPAVQRDRQELDRMLAQLSSLSDGVAFDIRRRLRVTSDVNAYSLDTLEAGLCTLVLTVPRTASVTAATWLHSVCVLETSLAHPAQWTMRLNALVVPVQAGMEWASDALGASWDNGSAARDTASGGSADVREVRPSTVDHAVATHKAGPAPHELSTAVDAHGRVEQLELWLSEKHRVPLRPYPTPAWSVAEARQPLPGVVGCACRLEDFCMALLRVTAEWRRGGRLGTAPAFAAGTAGDWPRVVFAVQPPRGGAPSLMALDLPAVQHLYEMLAAPPTMFAREAARRVEAEARAEVAAMLNICWHTTAAVRTPLKDAPTSSWWAEQGKSSGHGARARVDLCLSFAVLPRAATPSSSSSSASTGAPILSRVLSDLALPSSLVVNCTAQQTAAEAHVRASGAVLTDAVVGANTEAMSPVVGDFAAAVAACIRQHC